MSRNMSYYMNSCFTSEHTDHVKCSKFKHSRSETKDGTWRYKGLHHALRCEVLNSSLELRISADFLALRWVAIGPHKLAAVPAVLQPKRCTSKAWATKAQQDWPINVAINSRLLACKASWESSILMPNPHYERDLTFKALALFNT
jgi:hypothetical protein